MAVRPGQRFAVTAAGVQRTLQADAKGVLAVTVEGGELVVTPT
jgi:hypothetical protein